MRRATLNLAAAVLGLLPALRAEDGEARSGPLEVLWLPTLEQGLEMARATGRPLFLMGYSLVPDGSTYTKLGEDSCRSVF